MRTIYHIAQAVDMSTRTRVKKRRLFENDGVCGDGGRGTDDSLSSTSKAWTVLRYTPDSWRLIPKRSSGIAWCPVLQQTRSARGVWAVGTIRDSQRVLETGKARRSGTSVIFVDDDDDLEM